MLAMQIIDIAIGDTRPGTRCCKQRHGVRLLANDLPVHWPGRYSQSENRIAIHNEETCSSNFAGNAKNEGEQASNRHHEHTGLDKPWSNFTDFFLPQRPNPQAVAYFSKFPNFFRPDDLFQSPPDIKV